MFRAQQDQQAHKGLLDHKELKVCKVRQVHKVYRDLLDLKEIKVTRVT